MMELGRVLAVRAAGQGPGSGYLVADRLVLTSAHVVGPVGSAVRVFRPAHEPVFDAVVAWRGTPGGRDDAALVRVEDARWADQGGAPARWGRTVTYRTEIPCRTMGVPEAVQRPGRAVELAQPSGTLNPGDGYVAGEYLFSVSGSVPEAGGTGGSPWGGLSGAALFCGDLLTGVVVRSPPGWANRRIAAVPVSLLLRDAGFRRVLTEHGGAAELEPVEFQVLAEPPAPAGPGVLIPSPAGLLVARRAVVPLYGREELLGDLREWAAGADTKVWLIHGPGGQGKTRVAHELAASLSAQGWVAVWPAARAAPEDMRGLSDAAKPLLVVIDYAETRSAQVTALLESCVGRSRPAPVRVLLLARTSGWWEGMRATDSRAVEELLQDTPLTALPALGEDAQAHRAAYRRAADAFAAALPQVRDQQGPSWMRLTAQLSAPRFDGSGSLSALSIHMTALADLLDAAHPEHAAGPGVEGVQRVEDRLLAHEYGYWFASAAAGALSPGLSSHTLDEAMAAALLLGADTTEAADTLLGKAPGLRDQPYDRRRAVREWIAALYPPARPGAPFGSLQPDRLAERFLGRHLSAHPWLPDALLPGADRPQTERMLTFYARAAAHPVFDHGLDTRLTDLAAGHGLPLALVAAEVATQVEHPSPLLRALGKIVEDPAMALDDLRRLDGRMPQPSIVLADVSEQLARRLVTALRQGARDDPGTFLPLLAKALNNLATRLGSGRLGEPARKQEALAASLEAVGIYRALTRAGRERAWPRRDPAAARREELLPDLAVTLHNLATRLSDLGRHQEAWAAIGEALAIRGTLVRTRPEMFLPDFAASLNTLVGVLVHVDRPQDAHAVITDAVRIYRGLAGVDPGSYLPDLSMALHNLALRLKDSGRLPEALATIDEALAIRRDLVRARPDAFLPDLARHLTVRALLLGELGRSPEALAAQAESAGAYRTLARTRPREFLPEFAILAGAMALRLDELGRPREALAAHTEAADAYRTLAQMQPDAFLPDFARALRLVAFRLIEAGRGEEALAAYTEAAGVYRTLARARPEEHLPDLAAVSAAMASRLADLDRWAEVVAPSSEAVDAYRTLARARPEEFLPELARSQRAQAVCLMILERWEEARAAAVEAAGAFGRLIRTRPEEFLTDFGQQLYTVLAACGENLGRSDDVAAAYTEAIDAYRQAAGILPPDFLPELATHLDLLVGKLDESGRWQEASDAVGAAIEVRRSMVQARPEEFLSELATSLQDFAVRSGKLGRWQQGLAAAAEAVVIDRGLLAGRGLTRGQSEQARLLAQEARLELSGALVSLALMLHGCGRRQEALAAASEALAIDRELAKVWPRAQAMVESALGFIAWLRDSGD
ncbi:tetratricopeptide repeat protein [Actinospica durhamensis]|uniref:Tetratricopeptide repeat protein n=1 Tax=Actinospica durhamensis TaxID=1508375 RepID=A0A941ENC6_9ACTN|nr:tetratricopeptide repeat protein [Actinospica durhamensis]MBR7834235.1 tetratricopeptide repeat protein [Actinospica durhamensis]